MVKPVEGWRREVASVALDPSHSAMYLATLTLAFLRDYTNPVFAIAADAAILAIKNELYALEKDEQDKRRELLPKPKDQA